MIIGEKDKERVRLLEVYLRLANELINDIRDDLDEIGAKMCSEGIDTTNYPYTKIFHDIGRCSGYLYECKIKIK